jgi:hypothetical protein
MGQPHPDRVWWLRRLGSWVRSSGAGPAPTGCRSPSGRRCRWQRPHAAPRREPSPVRDTPHVYVTRRTYDRADDVVTLTCMGGPEYPLHHPVYMSAMRPSPEAVAGDGRGGAAVRAAGSAARPAVRLSVARADGLQRQGSPRGRRSSSPPEASPQPRLQGVGFLPSIYGGHRLARLLAGQTWRPASSTR